MKILMIGSLLTVNGGVQQYIRNLLLHMDLAVQLSHYLCILAGYGTF